MTVPLILALLVLLLPIPLSYLIPVGRDAVPDPWYVERLRRHLISWPAFGIVIFVGVFPLFAVLTSSSLSNWPMVATMGFLMWAVGNWLVLATLIVQLRRGKPDPLRGAPRRAASLVPRHRGSGVERRWWWLAGGVWLLGPGAMAAFAPERVGGTFLSLFVHGIILFHIAPQYARWAARSAEPLPTEAPERLVSLYERRRRLRGGAAAMACVSFVFAETLVVAAEGWSVDPDPILPAVSVLWGGILLVYLVRELALTREIRSVGESTPAYSDDRRDAPT